MFAVQISKNRKAYQTITGPTGFNGAHDNFLAVVKFRADKGVKVRLVEFNGSTKPRILRSALAEGKHMASMWVAAEVTGKGGEEDNSATLSHSIVNSPANRPTQKSNRRAQGDK